MTRLFILLIGSFFVFSAHAENYRCASDHGTRMSLSSSGQRPTFAFTTDEGDTFQCVSLARPSAPARTTAKPVLGDYSRCVCVNGFCTGGIGNVCEEANNAGLLRDAGSLLYNYTGGAVGRGPGKRR